MRQNLERDNIRARLCGLLEELDGEGDKPMPASAFAVRLRDAAGVFAVPKGGDDGSDRTET